MKTSGPFPAEWSLGADLLHASLAAGLLAGVVLLARHFGHRRLPVAWWYGLGLLAMIRFALPMVPQSEIGLRNPWRTPDQIQAPVLASTKAPTIAAVPPGRVPSNASGADLSRGIELQNFSSGALPDSSSVISSTPVQAGLPQENLGETLDGSSVRILEMIPTLSKATPSHQSTPFSWIGLSGWLWLTGTLGILLRAVGQSLRFHVRLKRATIAADAATQQTATWLAGRAGLDRSVTVLEIPLVPGPVSCGWRRPLILLPKDFRQNLSDDDLRHILSHEMAHLRHRDTLLNWLLLLLAAVHWWNPMAWLTRRAVLADRELLRDQQALSCLDHSAPAASYGGTLLKIALLHQQTVSPAAGANAFFTHPSEIQHRLTMITHPIATPRRLTRILVGLAASAAAGVAFSQAPNETSKPAGPGQPASADAAATDQEQGREVVAAYMDKWINEGKIHTNSSSQQPKTTGRIKFETDYQKSLELLGKTGYQAFREPKVLPPPPQQPPITIPDIRHWPDSAASKDQSPRAEVLETPGPPLTPPAAGQTADPAAAPRATVVEPARPSPASELEQLRQEVQTLRQESALLKAQLQQSPVDPQAQLESLLLTAELNYVREREEFGARHPRMVAAAKQLDQLKHMLETRKEEQFKREEMVNVKKNRKVRELAETKARIIQLATQLEPGAALGDAAPEIRRKAYDEMGDLRARAEGLETELRFGLLED